MRCLAAALLAAGPAAGPALADPPEILGIRYDGRMVSVTIAHADTGWDHYADLWEVRDLDGEVLGTRILAHPHVEEQPFTRSLPLELPGIGPTRFTVHARDNLGHWSAPALYSLR